MHYIYHIPERRKIGVTTNLARRMNEHKWTEAYIILEQHEDAKVAGDREWELQDEHGYPRDKVHYMISRQNRRRWDNTNKVYTSEHASYANSCRKNTKRSDETKLKISTSNSKCTDLQKEYIINQYKNWNESRYKFCVSIGSEFNVSRSTIDRIIKQMNE